MIHTQHTVSISKFKKKERVTLGSEDLHGGVQTQKQKNRNLFVDQFIHFVDDAVKPMNRVGEAVRKAKS